ncbi:MAG: type III-B CRISPR module RAMP protein Cmr6 [Betaproteobacteria bacterium HGW-Betaproteobacteria-17]|nr:MAG: type III-B CRISPR module RAMP protein Cmr6 [Betaproteobacteria bacterium HGW-Betaproteobacteria-17]
MLDTNKQPVMLSMRDVLFGRESKDGDSDHLRGALSFWDVIPQIKGDSLTVEIMTPHQTHYYQQKLDRKAGDSVTPHDSGQPNPIHFLTVPPGSGFTFHVVCDTQHLARLAPALAANDRWQALLTTAFEHAFAWLGFGAKTAVGYGAMAEDPELKQRREQAAQAVADTLRAEHAARQREAELAALPPTARAIREFLDARPDKNQTELSALFSGLKRGEWSGDVKLEIARHVEQLMRDAKKWKEKSEKKNPDKDHDYQDTLKVNAWLSGK